GLVFPQAQVLAVAAAARKLGLALHLDGARLWNAAAATQTEPSALAAPFDTVNVCFSKGLGAPAGSALAGSHEAIRAARRFRKMLGGGMRQAGILAAGALYALEHHRARLAEDHEHALLLSDGLRDIDGIEVPQVETNIVLLRLSTPVAMELAEALARRGVLAAPFERDVVRFVTHLDVSRASVAYAITQIQQVCREVLRGTRG
ncbi:MAG TPA: beta-eliminating lyase-related protein, partial [Polyangiaceae bacterium]